MTYPRWVRRRDVLLQRDALVDRLDRREVHADARRVRRHVLASNLHPRAGSRAEVEHALGLGEELILLVELQQLERGTRAIAALLGEVVELVESLLSDLVLHWHGARTLQEGLDCDVASDRKPVSLFLPQKMPAVAPGRLGVRAAAGPGCVCSSQSVTPTLQLQDEQACVYTGVRDADQHRCTRATEHPIR